MAQATTTVLGDIALGGDLAGNNNALAPELTSVGVTPGQYIAPKVTVDAKGRTTNIIQSTPSELIAAVGTATTSTKGVVQVGSGLSVTTGNISVIDATTLVKGIVQVGSGLLVTSGSVSVDMPNVISNIPDATTLVKGLVQVGSGLSVTGGVVSLNAPDATTTTKGIMQVGSGLSVTGGVVSLTPIADATTTTKGIMQVGSGLSVTGGVVSLTPIADATTTTKGIMQVGSRLSVTGGVVSAPLAESTTTYGMVKSADLGNITITSGAINTGTNIPKLNILQQWTAPQNITPYALTYNTTITPDFSQSNMFTVTLTGNATLANPANKVIGGTYIIIVRQDATGGRTLGLGGYYVFAAGASTLIDTDANRYNVFQCVVVDATTIITTLLKGF